MSRNAAVVIGSKVIFGNRNHQRLFFPGREHAGLCKACQLAGRISQLAARRFHINLHHFFSGGISRVGHDCRNFHKVVFVLYGALCLKGCVGKPVAERIQHLLLGKGFKVAIAYVNVLLIIVLYKVAEIFIRRIVRNRFRNGVRQLAAGVYRAGEHVQKAVAALLSSLPCIHNRVGPVLFHPAHVDNVSHVQQHNHPFKGAAYPGNQILFLFREPVASGFVVIILVLAGSPPNNHKGCVRPFRSL